MRLELLPEPDLQFGSGKHIDIRYGLRDYGPIGFDLPTATRSIRIGFVGTAVSIQGVRDWMIEARHGIPQSHSKKPRFRPAFPGFGCDSPFRCDWVSEARLERCLSQSAINDILSGKSKNESIKMAAGLFSDECRYLDSTGKVDVIICAPPNELLQYFDHDYEESEEPPKISRNTGTTQEVKNVPGLCDFHDLLKALSLSLSCPIQFIRPPTYDGLTRSPQSNSLKKHTQDAATRAWNFYTALYYKAGGTPWRLLRRTSDLESCYIGVSFFKTNDKQKIHTSLAQVFNERGEGMILRGGEAMMSKDDLHPHLSATDMKLLVENSLCAFEREHHHLPARVVIHKTSSFTAEELAGSQAAIQSLRVRHHDLLVLHESDIRLFRSGVYPPLRGTFLELDSNKSILYSRGSVPFFEMYPGQYVPRALMIESASVEQPQRVLAQEILALTKMNWNNTQFDSLFPITIRAARQVGSILKYAADNDQIHSRYAYYM